MLRLLHFISLTHTLNNVKHRPFLASRPTADYCDLFSSSVLKEGNASSARNQSDHMSTITRRVSSSVHRMVLFCEIVGRVSDTRIATITLPHVTPLSKLQNPGEGSATTWNPRRRLGGAGVSCATNLHSSRLASKSPLLLASSKP